MSLPIVFNRAHASSTSCFKDLHSHVASTTKVNRINPPHAHWDGHCETGNDEEHCRDTFQHKAEAQIGVFLEILGEGSEGWTGGAHHVQLVLHHLVELGAVNNDSNHQQSTWATQGSSYVNHFTTVKASTVTVEKKQKN